MKYDFVIDELDMESSFGKILSQVAPGSKVLECGCATGYMTRYMKEKLNCDVYIIEIDQAAFEIAKAYAKDGICTDLTQEKWCEKFEGMIFDTILLCDVLEHVIDPVALLRKAASFLKEDGTMLISLPNVGHNDILMRLYEGHWDYQERGLLDNTHIRFWGIENIEALFAENELKIALMDATLLPTGRTEQYWGKECLVDPQFLSALRRRYDGEIYQFVLTVQHAAHMEKNQVHTQWAIEKGGPEKKLMPIWQASDYLERETIEGKRKEDLLQILMTDNEQLNEKMRETRIYHEELLSNVQEMTDMLEKRTAEQMRTEELLKELIADKSAMNGAVNTLIERNSEIEKVLVELKVSNCLLEKEKQQLYGQAEELTAELAEAQRRLKEQTEIIEAVQNEKKAAQDRCSTIAEERNRFEQELNVANSYVQAINESRAHRLAEKYYSTRDKILPVGSRRRQVLGRIVHGTKNLIHPRRKEAPHQKNQIELMHEMGKYERMDVITTPHCMYIARLAKRALEQVGIQCEIQVGEPETYLNIPYLIIAPQFVKNFPPVYFVFQVEQTISSRWFTPEYFVSLQNSCFILDYALQNVEFFHRPENEDVRSRVYYVPLDYYPNYLPTPAPEEKEYDVLFYGSIAGDRRGKILKAVGEKYNLKIVSELFGEDLYREIRKAKVVLNIHYYEGALIETTRLFEALSLNSSVIVSEDSFDKNESGRLEEFVDFVPVDNTEKLLERIGYWLSHDEERKAKVKANQKALEHRSNAFEYFFYRFLLAHDRITFDQFYKLAGNFFELTGNKICLSLPESTERRRSFDNDNKYDFQCIPGLRHEKGWIGAGMSYKFIFKKALESKQKNIMICEDDVIFPDDFSKRLQHIMGFLNKKERWSVFSGVMADVGNVEVLETQVKGNTEYIQIDHMISMVFNIYNRQMFSLLARWDETNRDVTTNAIDRYLEKRKLNVYTQLPFLVGHKEELRSTIWGFSNSQYADMIAKSEKKLKALAEEFKQKKSK